MSEAIREWLTAQGLSQSSVAALTPGLGVLIIVVLSILIYVVCSRIILSRLVALAQRSSFRWDDVLIEHRVIHRLAFLAPVYAVYLLAPLALDGQDELNGLVKNAVLVAVIVIGVWAAFALLNAVYDIYAMMDTKDGMPIRGPIQGAKVVVILIGGLLVVAIALDRSPLYLMTGLGALSAVLMLVFKDPILGFMAGIQLASNDMVSPGDWIEMPAYDADGDVIEVGLTMVTVQNFDKTITMVPTYALISEAFKNWRGMEESEGRQIKRSISIDLNSVKFCTEEMIERFSKIDILAEYMTRKRIEIEVHNESHGVSSSLLVNGRHLTNIGTYRAYVEAYLRLHPMINQEMSLLVRQLDPTEHGLPIQIYVFCKDKDWANYESIQADIFDHLLVSLPEFDLEVFQSPSGGDFSELAANLGPDRHAAQVTERPDRSGVVM